MLSFHIRLFPVKWFRLSVFIRMLMVFGLEMSIIITITFQYSTSRTLRTRQLMKEPVSTSWDVFDGYQRLTYSQMLLYFFNHAL